MILLRRHLLLLTAGAFAAREPAFAQTGPNDAKLRGLFPQMLELAQQVARENGKTLLLTHESVKDVESVLAALHNHYKRTKEEDGVFGLAFMFGVHIIAVVEKNIGPGVLEKDHAVLGKDSFPFTLKGQTITPVHWCLKRILDGPADNVWIKYQTLVLQAMR